MKILRLSLAFLFFLLSFSLLSAQGNLVLEDNSNNSVVFALEITEGNNQEKIKITRNGGTPADVESSIPLVGDYGYEPFREICSALIGTWSDIDLAAQNANYERQLYRIFETWQTKKIENTVKLLSEEKVAGLLKVNSRPIIVTDDDDDVDCSDVSRQSQAGIRALKNTEKLLEIRSVSFTISDNYIYSITIEGIVDGNEVTIRNHDWSLSLKSRSGQILGFKYGGTKYKFCYKDVFTYQSDELTGAFSYYVKDAEFNLKPGEQRKLYKRSLNEYLGINISSDFLGLNTSNANGLLTTDFNAILPLNINNKKHSRWLDHASVRLSFTVLNGANGNNDFRNLSTFQYITTDPVDTSEQLFVDVFDLIRFHNINLDFYQSIYAVEVKPINAIFHGALGVDFYRSGLRQIIESPGRDTVNEFNVFSSAPYLKFLAQYRPDLNFGADLQYEVKWMRLLNNDNDNPAVFLSDGLLKANDIKYNELENERKFIHSFELDLYGQLGSRAGVFARIGVDMIGFKPDDNVFLRATVGYSTNLSAYINSVDKK